MVGKLIYSAQEIHDGVVSTMNRGGSGVVLTPPDQIYYVHINKYNKLKKRFNISFALNIGAAVGMAIGWICLLASS